VNRSRKGLERTLEPSETALLRLEGGDGNIFSWILPPHLFLSWKVLSFTRDGILANQFDKKFESFCATVFLMADFLKKTRHYCTLVLKIQKNPRNKKTRVSS
jgi:hypothetical protein